jgi:hypothetical protein
VAVFGYETVMKALVINCTLKKTPERELAERASLTLQSSLEDLGVDPDIAYPSDFRSPTEPYPTDPRSTLRGGLPANWLIESILESRILGLLVCPSKTESRRVALEALHRVGAVLDIGRAAGAKVGAPFSLEEDSAENRDLLALCCRLLDAGYLVPEQAWRTWGTHGLERRSQRAARDLFEIAGTLGAIIAGEGMTSQPQPPPHRSPESPG